MIKIVNKRNTIQKSLVLETVKSLKNHATADEVYEHLVITHPSISRGTVYRNLNQLTNSGEIQKIEVPNGADRFDHQTYNHYHVKCSVCEKFFDVDMDYMKNLEKTIRNVNGFKFCEHNIIFSGICPKCNKLN